MIQFEELSIFTILNCFFMNLETAAKIFKWCLIILGACYIISISFDLMSKKSTLQNAGGLLLLIVVITGLILISKQKTKIK